MFERFTDGARMVVVLAQEESRLLNHNRIGTGHLLLALPRAQDGDAGRTLQAAGVTLDGARHRLEESAGRGRKAPSGHIPFTPRAKKVLELASSASQRHGQQSIGPVHLLCALLEVHDGTGFQLLVDLGVDTSALAVAAEDLGSIPEPAQPGGAIGPVKIGFARVPRATAYAREAEALAVERNELARSLARYVRHDDGCDPARVCTCGLSDLLTGAGLELVEGNS